MAARSLAFVPELPEHRMNERFSARRPPGGLDLDPFINVDLYHMTGPVFQLHPHAGFSAVTYLFDDSTTPIHNRDSLGDDGLIEPGGVHWTIAGSGIMHDEFVEHTGLLGHGAQIFVRLPPEFEEAAPSSVRYGKSALPMIDLGEGARARVVAGSLPGAMSPVIEPTGVNVLEVWLEPDVQLALPIGSEHRAIIMGIEGSVDVRVDSSTGHLGSTGIAVADPGSDSVVLGAGAAGARLFVGSGIPLRTPSMMHGGFHFSSRERVVAAVDRYQHGEMAGVFATDDTA